LNPCGKHFGDTQLKKNQALGQRMMRKKMEGKDAHYTQEHSLITRALASRRQTNALASNVSVVVVVVVCFFEGGK